LEDENMKKTMFILLGLIFLLSINMVFAEQINAQECTSLSVNQQKPYFDVTDRLYNVAVVYGSETEGVAKFEINGQITGPLKAGDLYTINENKHLKVEGISGTTVNFCLFTYVPCVDVLDKIFQDEQKTYRIGNDRYTIKAEFSSDNKVKFRINSELTNEMQTEGSYYSFGDGIPKTKIMLKEVGKADGKNYARYCLDSSKFIMTFEQEPKELPETEISKTEIKEYKVDLANFPELFAIGNYINAIIVVGDKAPADDVIAATDISLSFEGKKSLSPTLLASEVTSLNQNIISVGNPCDNPITSKITGITECTGGLKPGQAVITIEEHGEYVHLVVFGYSRLETRQAARALTMQKMAGQKEILEFDTPALISEEKKVEEPQISEAEEECVQFGIRMIEQGKPVYCDIDKTFKSQKEKGKSCQNNYECLSNTCHDGMCQSISEKIEDIEKELKEQRGILNKLVGFFKRLFSF
jgi:hypothetical protein